MAKMKRQLWILNFSKKDIYLEDLGLKIPSMCSLDLFKTKINEESIWKSVESGSIFKKSRYVTIRKGPPTDNVPKIEVSHDFIIKEKKSGYQHNNEKYEELEMDDAEFANKFGDGLEDE